VSGSSRKLSFVRTLYFRVLVGVVAGVLIGVFWPGVGESLRPFGDGFIKLVRMIVAPIIFLSVVVGIAGVGDLRRLGRIGLKSLLYFEVVSTIALLLGMTVAAIVQPGRGMNVDVHSLDTKVVAKYAAESKKTTPADFALNIIPDTFAGAFTQGEILQVLFLAILTGLALAMMGGEPRITGAAQAAARVFYKIIGIIMEAAPLGAMGAMAFTVGKYGLATLLVLGKLLLSVYITSVAFVVVVLGGLCLVNGINIWRLIVYLREELLIVLATSSSEPVLPRMLVKMENLGCSRVVTGLVIPAGYSFNLDGTSIYLSIGALFVAQATNTHLTIWQLTFILFILMLNSKGAATVTGGGLITLAGTLTALGTIPVAGVSLLLGVDRFMSEMRSLTNLIGNGVATIVIAKWEKQFDAERARLVLNSKLAPEDQLLMEQNSSVV
jgi:aerobic C4-dicarboxylate transport protein